MYPTDLVDLPNPDPKAPTNSAVTPLAGSIANLNAIVEALQEKVGIDGSTDPMSVDWKVTNAVALAAGSLPATDDALGTLIAGATAKTTPVDADNLVLADSAASNTAKRITWANLKTEIAPAIAPALDGVFARLAGLAGGQTLTGGTAASESLTLRSTGHATKGKILLGSGAAYDEPTTRLGVGTQSPAAELHALATTEQLRLGYDASNYESTTVSAAGVVARTSTGGQWSFKAGVSSATLGSELVTNGDFTSNLGSWTDSGSSWSWSAGAALHTAGSSSTLTQSVTVTNGATYQIAVTISGRTAGSIDVALGGVAVVESGQATAFTSTFSRSVVANATGSVNLVISPTTDFNGSIDAITLKAITLGSVLPVQQHLDESSGISFEQRASGSSVSCQAIGRESHRSITSGVNNTACGPYAQRSLTTGMHNTGIGTSSQYSLTVGQSNVGVGLNTQYSLNSGSFNVAVGHNVQYAVTTGSSNTGVGNFAHRNCTSGNNNSAMGSAAQFSITTGANNSCCGLNAQYSLTTGSGNSGVGNNVQYSLTGASANNTALGSQAQRYLADGSTAATAADNSTYVGASTKQSANSVTNENVFGYNATGIGSNSCVIGSSAVTKCQIFGGIILDKTVTAAGTTGAQTINKTVGSVNFAAGATSLVVTNNRVATSSIIIATVATNDTTLKSVVAVAASGSFTLTANAAATAETRVNFCVIN